MRATALVSRGVSPGGPLGEAREAHLRVAPTDGGDVDSVTGPGEEAVHRGEVGGALGELLERRLHGPDADRGAHLLRCRRVRGELDALREVLLAPGEDRRHDRAEVGERQLGQWTPRRL